MANKNFDNCVSFHINNGAFRGRLVRLGETVDTIIGKHCYPAPVAAVLAESTALAVLLASTLKYDGLFTLQTQSNGPVSMVVVDVTSEGRVRGCVRYDSERLQHSQQLRKNEGEIEPAPHLMGEGWLAFTVDQGPDTQLYQGVVDLQGKTLTECALRYFKQSEQIDTDLQLFLHAPQGDSMGWSAGGIFIQKLPEIGGKIDSQADLSENWNEAKIFMQSLTADEIFNTELSSADLLHRLYHSSDLVISAEKHFHFGCRCSREKLQSTLSGFKAEELDGLYENGQIAATCDFCSEKYIFDKGELIKQ